MPIYAIDNLIPVIHPSSYVHPSAEIIGDVIIEAHCYIGPNAVLRGDFGRIYVSENSNIQDCCVLHSFPNKDCYLEPYSHIGHCAVLHGCYIGKNALIGMNAVIMDDVKIGAESIVAASSFVKSSFECDERSMLVGSPAKILRKVTDDEMKWKKQGTEEYVILAKRCNENLKEVTPLNEVQIKRPRFQSSVHTLKK
ncbi:DapH/DapD/GlmU-related protein [Pseudocolwellia sp. HL-MZ19]|uniref:DapH/DapD/GlmU-related protein n=1 Tax=Pseudocolwellia sp. HL-MZ19 TaxID=3400846 RepID=UPI003CE73015